MSIQDLKGPVTVATSGSSSESFTGVKLPISLDTPDRILTRTYKDASGYGFSISNDDYTFQQQTVENDAILEFWDTQNLAQKFTTGAVGNRLKKMTLTLNRPGSASGNTTVEIHSDSNGSPSVTVVGTSNSLANSSITQGVKQGYTFTFANEVSLNPSTTYWIVVKSSGTSAYKMNWYCRITGADSASPASVWNGSVWTNDTTRNMTYMNIGYYTDGTVEASFKLKTGIDYKTSYILADSDASSSVTIDLINVDSGATLYSNLQNDQAIAVDPTVTPNLKIRATLRRDPSTSLNIVKVKAVGFTGTVAEGKYRFVDREFTDTDYTDATVGSNITITSGGATLKSASPSAPAASSVKSNNALGWTDNSSSFGAGTTGQWQNIFTNQPLVITGASMRAYFASTSYTATVSIYGDNGLGGLGSLITSATFTPTVASYQTFSVTFPSPVSVTGSFYIVLTASGGTIYPSYYSTGYDNRNSSQGSSESFYFDLQGYLDPNTIVMDMTLPSVEVHGLLYASMYLPSDSSVALKIVEPTSRSTLLTLSNVDKSSLALLDTQLFNRVKVIITLNPSTNGLFPIVGLSYHYTGSSMSPEPLTFSTYLEGKTSAIASTSTASYTSPGATVVDYAGGGFLTGLSLVNSYSTSWYTMYATITIDGNVIMNDQPIGFTGQGAGVFPCFLRFNKSLKVQVRNTTSSQGTLNCNVSYLKD